jgi:thioredoxin 1
MKALLILTTLCFSLAASAEVRIIKFSAEWCKPCKDYKPVIDKVVKELKLDMQEVDIDKNPNLANKFAVEGVPTTVFLDGDKEVARILGSVDEKFLKQFTENVIKSTKGK